MRRAGLIGLCTLSVLISCTPANRISSAEQADLDCLAARTVVQITSAIRDGVEAGRPQEELQKYQQDFIQEGLIEVRRLFPDLSVHHHYYEYETAHMSLAIQDAAQSAEPNSEAYQAMIDTLSLGETCEVAQASE